MIRPTSALKRFAETWRNACSRSVESARGRLARGSLVPWWVYVCGATVIIATVMVGATHLGMPLTGALSSLGILLSAMYLRRTDAAWARMISSAHATQAPYLWAQTYGGPIPAALLAIPVATLRAVTVYITGAGATELMLISGFSLAILAGWSNVVDAIWGSPGEDYAAGQTDT